MAISAGKKRRVNGRPWLWNHIHLSILMLAVGLLLSFFIGLGLYALAALQIPDVSSVASYRPPTVTVFLDDKEEPIAEFFRERRYVVPVSAMPELLPAAFVAAEDGRFYQHGGVDGWSVLRAMVNNLRSGRRSQGGSTITQQVARSLLLTREKTYTRKVKEAILAYRIDSLLDKEEILYLYLNQLYLGEGTYGVGAAARVYFDKDASELNLAEISLLAGLPQAPSRYSPLKNFKLAKARQRYVLNRMAADGYITPEEARQAYRRGLRWRTENSQDQAAGQYFVEHVRRYIEDQYGREELLTGGLVVHTTMNSALQEAAATSVKRGVAEWSKRNPGSREKPQAALIAIEVDSNRVTAMVGGTDFTGSQYNRAVQARRQPGSAFKPIIFGAALQRAVTPADLLLDEPVKLPGNTPGQFWEPQNFSGDYYGRTTVWTGLVKSRNIVSIKLLQKVGIESVRSLAGRMGISAPLDDNLSLALGTSGVSLLEMTGAYNVFAGRGLYRSPLFVTKVVDRYGNILENGDNQEVRRALPPKDAYLVTDLLKGVIEYGTGRSAQGLSVEAAGKTGTSDGNLDAWFIGYTPELAAGVWLGFDRNITLGKHETGGRSATPIWLDFMKKANLLNPAERKSFTVPEGVVFLPMDPSTGEIKAENSPGVVDVAFKESLLPVK
ncbi:MAG: PBP1A family penicillin-binding protein [Desulfobulbaceae bacterium]|nr:PBP1A family penicillin-binding protein [Desulfobulbaceae bacterium]